MRASVGVAGVLSVVVAVLTGCAGPMFPAREIEDPDAPPPPASWSLRHRVRETTDITVVSAGIDRYGEYSELAVRSPGRRTPDTCYVTAAVVGHGGPDDRVGEKVADSVRGRPALRGGAGAEAPYVIWQAADRRWIGVDCGTERSLSPAAARVETSRRTTLLLPVALDTLPAGFRVDGLDVGTEPAQLRLQLSGPGPHDDLQVQLSPGPLSAEPSGDRTEVAGRPALRNDDPRFPGLCVLAGGDTYACVGPPASDTGPYPDRSDQVPTIETVARSLRFADLEDPRTWFEADSALP